MSEKMGIVETKEMVTFIAALVNGIGRTLEDGEVSWWDARHFIDAFSCASDAVTDAGKIMCEIADMNAGERHQLILHFSQEVDIPQDWAEAVIEWVFEIGIGITKILELLRERQALKSEE